MSDTQDTLVERLREIALGDGHQLHVGEIVTLDEAATALADRDAKITELEQKLERATEALEPFATEADQWEGFSDDENLVEMWNGGPATNLTVAHLREARTARAFLNSSSKDEGLQTGASQNG